MSDSEDERETQQELLTSDVVTKFKAAAEIANKAIAAVIAACKDGARIFDICKAGDDLIMKEMASIFKGKQIEKGIAFPTCVSVNSVVGHFSPMEDNQDTLKTGDVVKIDLGAHIDGWVATQAQTIVVAPSFDAPVSGPAADAIAAARTAFEAALRLIRPGRKISEVAPILAKIVESYGCNLVEGVMSHQMRQFVIDGTKCVLNRPSHEAKVEDGTFEEHEVYAIDIVVSTGEGKPKVVDEKETTVYKRALDVSYNLRMKASRAVFHEINTKAPALPFALRCLLEGEGDKAKELGKQLKLGLVECLNHGLLQPYPVLHEKAGDVVAQVKGTVLLMPNGSDKITSAPAQPVNSAKSCEDEEIKALLAQGLKNKKKKDKKAKAVAA